MGPIISLAPLNATMTITIDRRSPVPVYRQIVAGIREYIASGTWPPGFRLPPERTLAKDLGVNRTTVLNAYRELKAEALVEGHVGRGTSVVGPAPVPAQPGATVELPWRQLFRTGLGRSQDPLLRDLLALTERNDVIPLAVGLPAPKLLPLAPLRDVLARLLVEVGPGMFLHSPTEGISPLREAIAGHQAARGFRRSPEEILITSGCQQGLDLVTRVLVDPGDAVVVEEPTYFGALEVFRRAQARILPVPADDHGLRTDLLEVLLQQRRPKLIYTLPTFQNPSGAVLSLERRRHLLALAARFAIPVVEDDPYAELHYEGPTVPSLQALDSDGIVLSLHSFSKVLFPGLRVGWLTAPHPVLRQLTLARQGTDLHTNTPGQWVITRFLTEGLLDGHLRGLREAYRQRRDVALGALQATAPPGVSWTPPRGGFYIWCRLPDRVSQGRLLARASEAGVAFLPGAPCFADEAGVNAVRLNFTFPSESQLREGITRLMAAVAAVMDEPPTGGRPGSGTPPLV